MIVPKLSHALEPSHAGLRQELSDQIVHYSHHPERDKDDLKQRLSDRQKESLRSWHVKEVGGCSGEKQQPSMGHQPPAIIHQCLCQVHLVTQ